MCIGGGGGIGKFLGPIDPITSKVREKVLPEPIKKLDSLPFKAMKAVAGEETTTKILHSGLSTPDAKKNTKTLLGE